MFLGTYVINCDSLCIGIYLSYHYIIYFMTWKFTNEYHSFVPKCTKQKHL